MAFLNSSVFLQIQLSSLAFQHFFWVAQLVNWIWESARLSDLINIFKIRLGWNGEVDGQTIHLTENFISMNFLQMSFVITYSKVLVSSMYFIFDEIEHTHCCYLRAYSCNKIIMTQIQISRQKWNGFFSNSHTNSF